MARYEIVVDGTAGSLLAVAVEGMDIEPVAGGRSRIVGDLVDQQSLQLLLRRLGDLHVSIVAVRRLDG